MSSSINVLVITCLALFVFAEVDAQDAVQDYYHSHETSLSSQSKGIVSNGSLVNGKLMPFSGANFYYFDTASYLAGRAFLNDRLHETILQTYQQLEQLCPGRQFGLMECANEHGGKMFPHRTHQNGLSVDFMMPLVKDGEPYYGLDDLGADHYWLEFDNNGSYIKDKSVKIDFDLVAQHILKLDHVARQHNLKISKVIIKTELKDELFATKHGAKLKASEIYVVKHLSPLINSLHDDHYHIDFEILNHP